MAIKNEKTVSGKNYKAPGLTKININSINPKIKIIPVKTLNTNRHFKNNFSLFSLIPLSYYKLTMIS